MPHPRQASHADTAYAEWRANETLREQDEPVMHKCGRCWGPFGKSAIRCVNEPGGK